VTLAAHPAHEASGENGGRRPLEGCVDLVVSDDGQGIDPAHRDLIFSRFWHGSGRGSTGLGLYVVKGLVEAHGGRILVETAPSGGAQFRFSLPSEAPEYLQ
jgi:signal transduction histidine kinase